MRASDRLALFSAGAYIIIRLIFFLVGWGEEQQNYLIAINLMCILLAIWIGLRIVGKEGVKKERTGLDDIKSGMRITALYALGVAIFVVIYYNYIDAQALDKRKQVYIENTDRLLADPAVEKPDIMTAEELRNRNVSQIEMIFSPHVLALITLVGLMLIGFVYTFGIVFLQRRVLSRLH